MLRNMVREEHKMRKRDKLEKGDTVLMRNKDRGKSKGKDLEWPRGFQEVKVPRFHDNGTGWS
jgi:hypothetical protein